VVANTRVLVERSQQLDVLASLLREPRGAVVLLEGEAGAGKSALLSAALSDLPAGVRVWSGRCEPLTIPAPFSALFELLGRLPSAVADAVRGGDAAVDVYAAVLDDLRESPTVLVVDDLQWADAATAGLVRYIGRRADALPGAVVCAYRADDVPVGGEAEAAIAELGRVAARIHLSPLTTGGVAELALHIAPERTVDAVQLHRATGGNPLFTVEVLRQTDSEVPATVGDIVLGRVRRLPLAAQAAVEAIALCPDGLGLDAAVQLSADAADHIDLACLRRILTVERRRVSCRHELIRAAIDASIGPARRRDIHRRLVAVLEPLADTDRDVALLAHHSAAAGDGPRALDYSLRAAANAISAGTHRHAADHLVRALEFRESLPTERLAGVLSKAADELVLASRYDEAIEFAGERLRLAREPGERAAVLAQLGFCWTRKGGYSAGQKYAERAVAAAAEVGAVAPSMAARVLAGSALEEGRFPDVVTHCDAAIAAAEATGATDDLVAALTNGGTALHVLADARWEDYLRRAVRLATAADLHDRAAHVLSNHANCLLAHYRLDEARRWFAEAIEFCDGREIEAWLGPVISGSARLELVAGDWDTAHEHLATERWARACWGSEAEAHGVLALLALRTAGDDRGHVANAVELADVSATHWDRIDAAVLVAESAWLGAGDPADAVNRLGTAATAPGVRHDPWACGRLAFWSRQLGPRTRVLAAELAGLALPGPFAHLAAGDAAAEAAAWRELGCPYEAALSAAHQPTPPIDEVTAALVALGADAALTSVRRDWRARGVTVRLAGTAHPSGLTPRQLDVLALLAAGCTNAEIANKLFISEKTAGHHVSAILTHLGARSRRSAAALALEHCWA
jgi:DNA-binding CsgD family transcriptional regulator/tetratricopeptide (TPR) repeat protein